MENYFRKSILKKIRLKECAISSDMTDVNMSFGGTAFRTLDLKVSLY